MNAFWASVIGTFPFDSRLQRDATDPEQIALSRRGELRLRPRYHPSCAADHQWRAHLSAVACVGATHPILLAGCSGFLRSNAQGRVPDSIAIPGLPPLPGRCDARYPYFSPSSRALRFEIVVLSFWFVSGDARTACQRPGRPRGERERTSGWNISSNALPRLPVPTGTVRSRLSANAENRPVRLYTSRRLFAQNDCCD